jgi:hypothetical protein
VRARLLLLLVATPLVAVAQEDEVVEPAEGGGKRLHVMGFGGALVDLRGSGPSAGVIGGEVMYSFSFIDVGLMAEAYHLDPTRSARVWTPVVLARFEEHFETRRGVDAIIAVGLGAAHTGVGEDWRAWYQFALGARVGLGPMFLAGEVGFEQLDLFRLVAGLGVQF